MELIQANSIDESDPIWAKAIQMSSLSPMKFKLGAVIVDKKGRILGKGYNSAKTHPLGSKADFKTLHAEIAALYDCLKHHREVRGSSIIVYRRGGRISKPCPCCEATLNRFGVKKIVYTNLIP